MKRLFIIAIVITLFISLHAQDTDANTQNKQKFILISTNLKPYIEAGINLLDNYYIISSLGFYKGDGDTYFRLSGGLQKFFARKHNSLQLYTGTHFVFEVNPGVVNQGNQDSRMRLQGFLGGWVYLTQKIAVDGKVFLSLDFNHYPNNDTVEFGLFTSSIGIAVLF